MGIVSDNSDTEDEYTVRTIRVTPEQIRAQEQIEETLDWINRKLDKESQAMKNNPYNSKLKKRWFSVAYPEQKFDFCSS